LINERIAHRIQDGGHEGAAAVDRASAGKAHERGVAKMLDLAARKLRITVLTLGCVLLILATFAWYWQGHAVSGATTSPASPAPVPVEIASASRADVPVYLEGLGTVQAFNTVTIKTRVDGQIQKVSFVEGQRVKAGDLLVQIDPRPFQAAYDQVVAKKAQDEAQLANAKVDLDRFTTLVKTNAINRQQADTQRALVVQLEALVRADQGAIEAAKVQLDYTAISSPIDGITGIRLVDEGNIVHATDTNGIVVVTQLQPISVVFTLPEDDLQRVSQAMAQGPVAVAALSRDGKTEFDRGTLLLIDNQIDQTTGTIRLKATFPNPHGALWPGQFDNVRLLLQTQHNVLTVPSAAIQRGPNGFFTYVVKPDSTVDMRTVTVGQDTGVTAVIDDGLAPGDRVVTAGQYRVQPGARVLIGTASSDTPAAKPDVAQSAPP
jgi:multidrug efflux system membrane fusion protein